MSFILDILRYLLAHEYFYRHSREKGKLKHILFKNYLSKFYSFIFLFDCIHFFLGKKKMKEETLAIFPSVSCKVGAAQF